MAKAVELLRQGRTDELWQMCCGFTGLSLEQFMGIQERLLIEQIDLLNHSTLGRKLMQGTWPESVEEFRRLVPLTTYQDYCPELLEKREDILPVKPAQWVHSSGRSSEFPFKWVPVTPAFAREMSQVMYGIGMMSGCSEAGNTSRIPVRPKVVYTVAPRPYISGAMASMLETQTPVDFFPDLEEAEGKPFEDRIKLGFRQALDEGFDYFFGVSLVLVMVGNKFTESSRSAKLGPLLRQPRALMRLGKGMMRSRLARRPMMPKDLWNLKGIMSSGLDSWVYRDKIKELWGRYPLDVYAGTEGGVMATQTWDYDSMTFIPNLNFLEFIPEKELPRLEADKHYRPEILLLNQVKAGETYELVITNFHGGIMTRYRIGDMIRISSLRNEQLGIDIPQMVFERRTDGLLDFKVVTVTEKVVWQAMEKSGIAYVDWTAYKVPGEQVLNLLVELKPGHYAREADIAQAVTREIVGERKDVTSGSTYDWRSALGFSVEVKLLPAGTFGAYTAARQAEGADLAHLKPPHINPPDKLLSLLTRLSVPVEVKTASGTEEKVPA